MAIRDYARGDVVTAPPEATAGTVADRMDDHGVGSVVITEEDIPVGIVTDRDLTMRIVAGGGDPAELTARDVMSADPTTIDAGASILDAAALMYEMTVRRLPVTEDDSLVGIIALDDLTMILANELSHLAGVVRAEAPRA